MGSKNVDKWNLRGWKLEPRYSSRTLVGDWYEERRAFARGSLPLLTSNMVEYKDQGRPPTRDWCTGISNKCHQQGSERTKLLLDHDYLKEKISTYELEYSHPFRALTTRYQPRKWDSKRCTWVPEKIDIPSLTKDNLYGTLCQMKENFQNSAAKEKTNNTKCVNLPHDRLNETESKTPKLFYKHNRGDKIQQSIMDLPNAK